MTALLTLAWESREHRRFQSRPKPFWCDLLLCQSSSSVAGTTGQKSPVAAATTCDGKTKAIPSNRLPRIVASDMNGPAPMSQSVFTAQQLPADFFAVFGSRSRTWPRVPPRRGRTGPRPNTHLKSQTLATPVRSEHRRIGKTVNIRRRNRYTMIGVRAATRNFPCHRLWIPWIVSEKKKRIRSVNSLHVVARLKDGASLTAAQAEMTLLGRHIAEPQARRCAGREHLESRGPPRRLICAADVRASSALWLANI